MGLELRDWAGIGFNWFEGVLGLGNWFGLNGVTGLRYWEVDLGLQK